MAVTTVTVHKVDPEKCPQQIDTLGGADGGRFTFTYEFRPGVSSNPCRGITWDGKHLWFSTNEHLAAARGAHLVCVDPVAGAVIKAVDTGLSTHLYDLAWHGTGFYTIAEDGLIRDIDTGGRIIRTVATVTAVDEQAIEWDGTYIYTAIMTSALAIKKYDPATGTLLRQATVSGNIGMPHGICFNGAYIMNKMVDTDAPLTFYRLRDTSAYGIMRSTNRAIYATGTERATIAWDGAYYWDFQETT